MATSSPMVTSSPIEDQYNVTAMGWASSPSPAELAEAIGGIHKFATKGAPEVVLERCEQLLNNSNPTLQECGFNLFLFLVRKRWSDLSDEQKQSVFSAVPKLIASAGMASAWSIKNTMAIIVSQLIGQDVAGNWAKLVAALSCDEIMADRTIVTCISEGITIPNDESKDKRSKDLKIENWDCLSEALFSVILKHLGKYNPSQVAEFQPQYDLVLFAANTVSAYAQWGEVKNLVKGVGGMDLIKSCQILLGLGGLFPAGIGYMSAICSRVKSTDCDHDVLKIIFYTVFEVLKHLNQQPEVFQFSRTICSSLVSVKEVMGPDFEDLKEAVASSLEEFKVGSHITIVEYKELTDKLCDRMVW